MTAGRRTAQQQPMWVAGTELARARGHKFYEKFNELLATAKFDAAVEKLCEGYFESDEERGRPSVAPGVHLRMLFL